MAESTEATKSKILQSAKVEFLEKGFTNASLRTIASNAGLTTGAMYRHFKDKDALFCALVDDAVETLEDFVDKGGFGFHVGLMGSDDRENLQNEDNLLTTFIDSLYENFDSYTLLLCKSAGSTHEHFLDGIADKNTENIDGIVEYLKNQYGETKQIDKFAVHMLATTMVSMFSEIVFHKVAKEDASVFMRNIHEFYHFGFMHMLGVPCKN